MHCDTLGHVEKKITEKRKLSLNIYVLNRDYYALKECETALKNANKELHCFTSAAQLKEGIRQLPPDIVLLEDEYPALPELARYIKEEVPMSKILLTGEKNRSTLSQLNLQLDGFLARPFNEQRFREQIHRKQHHLMGK